MVCERLRSLETQPSPPNDKGGTRNSASNTNLALSSVPYQVYINSHCGILLIAAQDMSSRGSFWPCIILD